MLIELFTALFTICFAMNVQATDSYRYSVRPGQTLSHIIKDVNISLDDILRENPGRNLEKLNIGEEINIPLPKVPEIKSIYAENEELSAEIRKLKISLNEASARNSDISQELNRTKDILAKALPEAKENKYYAKVSAALAISLVCVLFACLFAFSRWFEISNRILAKEDQIGRLRNIEMEFRAKHAGDISRLQKTFGIPEERLDKCLELAKIIQSLPSGKGKEELQKTIIQLTLLRSPLRAIPGKG